MQRHLTALLFMAVLAFGLLVAPMDGFGEDMANPASQIVAQTMNASEFQKLESGKEKPFVLDVREPDEYNAGHISGAVLIPLGQLGEHLAELPHNKTIVAYCRSGRRSAQAVALLRASGFTNAVSLAGGYTEYQASK